MHIRCAINIKTSYRDEKMRRKSIILAAVLVLSQLCSSLWALPTTAYEAEMAVAGWLKVDPQPLETALGQEVVRVETFTDDYGEPVYYIVYLEPSGFVIVSADDLIEPIIGFADDGSYDPSPENPLGTLVTNDLNGRMAAVHRTFSLQAMVGKAPFTYTQRKWGYFISLAETSEGGFSLMGRRSVSDVRVAPLVQSKWGQLQACDRNTHNYYTPNNYPTGCVATVMAQLMRYYQHPTAGIGVHEFPIWVDDVEQTASTRGGNGNGGAYKWDRMVLEPGCSTTLAQRKAIGALCYDAGISVNMDYTADNSGALLFLARFALQDTFQYNNAISGLNFDLSTFEFRDLGSELEGMVNPNLDAGHPVILGLRSEEVDVGHAILADGYGYNSSTLYHHLNMGWEGHQDAYYNLIFIDSDPSFNVVDESIYNIFTSGSGEIISGRVTDAYGSPISGATVTATRQGRSETYTDETDSKGIYALEKVKSRTTYTISAAKSGYVFTSQDVLTGKSEDLEPVSGNRWGINFVAGGSSPPSGGSVEDFETNDFKKFPWEHEGDTHWTTTSWENRSGNYSAQAGSIDHDESTTLKVTLDCAAGDITFYCKVSSESTYDYLMFYIDGVEKDTWSGEEDWAEVSFPVTAGTRTFEWTYSKDGSESIYDDTAWIDDIVFPVDSGPEPPAPAPPTPPDDQFSVEDFETNDFEKLPWEHEGDSYWTTTSWKKHSGNYSAQAASIDHDESTTLKVTLDCAAGDITFYCKVSSESTYDYLKFSIDGVEKDTWSGEEDWAEVSFPVTAGTRTFEWTYSKDGSESFYDDTAWIDDIVFPAQVQASPPPPPPPPASEWANQDIGWPGATGSARYDSATETWTIQGDGRDIWDQSDAFHYVYKPLSGDGEIIKRVVSVEYTDLWVKAGVMIRESLSASSKHAHLIIAPIHGCRFQLRRITSSWSESDTPVTNLQHIRPPHWLRLVRRGNQFRAYNSNDGRNWEELLWSPQTVVMRNDVYIGMVVTSHSDGVLCTAVFDN